MRLTRLDIRFFRSFNFDYEYKARPEASPLSWEERAPDWYPFVKIAIEPHVTAVVGANEAGKSQLLTALRAAVTGAPISRSDFCRYSTLFSVEKDAMRLPEFGCTFVVTVQAVVA